MPEADIDRGCRRAVRSVNVQVRHTVGVEFEAAADEIGGCERLHRRVGVELIEVNESEMCRPARCRQPSWPSQLNSSHAAIENDGEIRGVGERDLHVLCRVAVDRQHADDIEGIDNTGRQAAARDLQGIRAGIIQRQSAEPSQAGARRLR